MTARAYTKIKSVTTPIHCQRATVSVIYPFNCALTVPCARSPSRLEHTTITQTRRPDSLVYCRIPFRRDLYSSTSRAIQEAVVSSSLRCLLTDHIARESKMSPSSDRRAHQKCFTHLNIMSSSPRRGTGRSLFIFFLDVSISDQESQSPRCVFGVCNATINST